MSTIRPLLILVLFAFGCSSKKPAPEAVGKKVPLSHAVGSAESKPRTRPAVSGYVIVKDMQPVVAKMLELSRSAAAEEWTMESAQIADNHIKVRYKSTGGEEVELGLHHVEQTGEKHVVVGHFAIVGDIPDTLKDSLFRRIEEHGTSFSWKHVVPREDGASEGESTEAPIKRDRPEDANQKERHRDEAPFVLSKADQETEKTLDALFKKAWAGNAPDWEAEVQKILARRDLHPTLLYRIATSVRDLKSPEKAHPIYQRLLKALEKLEEKVGTTLPVRLELTRASAHLGNRDTASAIKSLNRALLVGGQDANWDPCQVPHYMMSSVGVADEQILHGWLDNFLSVAPQCRLAYRIKVDDLATRGKKKEAIKLLWALEKKGKAEMSDFYRLAELLVEDGDNLKAVDVYRRICLTMECTAHTRGNLVWAQSSFHRDPAVIKRYVGEAEASRQNSVRQFEVGVMLHYARRYTESLPFLIRASKIWPDDPRILLYTAMNYYRSGQQEKAEVAIEHAVESASQRDPDLYYCRSVIFRNSDLAKALENLERYRMLSSRGDVPPQKKKMVNAFIQAMKDELKRRAGGASPRPFADPEEDFFGEPPGSPGHAANAIHVPH